MTCFWDGLLKSLQDSDFSDFTKKKPKNNLELITFLQKHNVKANNVLWNNEKLSEKTPKIIEEHYQAVKEFDKNKISQGYLCSCCDFFLLLICQLFKLNIIHKYDNHTINYSYENKDKNKINTLYFENNKGHFWFVKRIF